jgi:lipoprotein-anchoring transpeptidase ErfK/SrfK
MASIAPQEPTAVRREIPPEFHRQDVPYDGKERPGVIVIDTPDKFLYLVEPGGRAMRYGIGVGRPGFEWSGTKVITRKAEWPDWTPPPEMLLRRPDLPRHMDGGPENPLGARALYLGSSMYRIHGTNEPWTIGQNVSSGCIRMMNEDVEDLYERIKVGTKVMVL